MVHPICLRLVQVSIRKKLVKASGFAILLFSAGPQQWRKRRRFLGVSTTRRPERVGARGLERAVANGITFE
jgi:hypothetical protein